MKIGIDLGGSHIGVGLIENTNIIASKDKILAREDRLKIEETIVASITNMIKDLCKENNIRVEDLEIIGIASPRYYFKWKNCKSWKFGS